METQRKDVKNLLYSRRLLMMSPWHQCDLTYWLCTCQHWRCNYSLYVGLTQCKFYANTWQLSFQKFSNESIPNIWENVQKSRCDITSRTDIQFCRTSHDIYHQSRCTILIRHSSSTFHINNSSSTTKYSYIVYVSVSIRALHPRKKN